MRNNINENPFREIELGTVIDVLYVKNMLLWRNGEGEMGT